MSIRLQSKQQTKKQTWTDCFCVDWRKLLPKINNANESSLSMTEAATEKTGPKCIREEVLNGPKNNIDIYI